MKITLKNYLLFIAVTAGILVLGGTGYFGVKQYQSYQVKNLVKENLEIKSGDKQVAIGSVNDLKIIETQSDNQIQQPKSEITVDIKPSQTEVIKSQQQLTEEELVIKDFLNNPSVDSFRTFCDKAKNVQSKQTKGVLSGDRTTMTVVNKTLFEVVNSCKILTDTNSGYAFVSNLDGLLVSFDNSDSDEVRVRKIGYNNQIKELNQEYKVYGYDIGLNSASTYLSISVVQIDLSNPNVADMKSNSDYRSAARYIASALKNIKIPEVEIKNILDNGE